MIEFVFDTTRAVTHLVLSGTLERCPDLRLIVPHAGGTIPYVADRIGLFASRIVSGATDRAPAGVKAYFRQLYCELAISTSPHAVAAVLQLAAPERILFGSDFPALFEEDVQSLIRLWPVTRSCSRKPGSGRRSCCPPDLDLLLGLAGSAGLRGEDPVQLAPGPLQQLFGRLDLLGGARVGELHDPAAQPGRRRAGRGVRKPAAAT